MTDAERQRKRRERLRQEQGLKPTVRQRLSEAQKEIEALTIELQETRSRAGLAKADREATGADPNIRLDTLPITAQQRLDAAVRQHKRRLDAQFKQAVQNEVERRLMKMSCRSFGRRKPRPIKL